MNWQWRREAMMRWPTLRTPFSAWALSRGFRTRAGRTTVP